MAAKAWPTANDLEKWLRASGATDAALGKLADFLIYAADAAKAEIERQTGIQFIADTSDTVRYYDPPTSKSRILTIHELSSLTTLVYQPLDHVAETLVLNEDFVTLPQNNVALGEPINSIRFLKQGWIEPIAPALRRSVIITGKWGRGTELPSDVWLAALQAGGLYLWENHRILFTGGLESWRDADRAFTYGSGLDSPLTQVVTDWKKAVGRVIQRYRSPRMHF